MDCDNCGAPMILIPDRDYFFCEHCGSFSFPKDSSEGINVLSGSADTINCPVCEISLLKATIDT